MTVHLRNVVTPVAGSGAVYQFKMWLWREALFCARWVEVANSGAAGWGSANIINTYSDLAVNPADPAIITTAGGTFLTTYVGKTITLFDPTNDANCVIANIVGVPTSSTLLLDRRNLAKAWVTASGLTGRIHSCGQTSMLPAGAWTIMKAPPGTGDAFEVALKVSSTANYGEFWCYPKGDYSGARTPTSTYSVAYGADTWLRMNGDIDGENFVLYDWHANTAWYVFGGGKLTDAAAGDIYPKFTTGGAAMGYDAYEFWPFTADQFGENMRMLGYANEQVKASVVGFKVFSDATHDASYGVFRRENTQFGRGKFHAVNPWVVMTDVTAGGYPRGKLPWKITHWAWTDWRLLNVAGSFRATEGALILPAGGWDGCDVYVPIEGLT